MDTKKDKILFVVSTLQHYCNFIKTGALKEIQDRVIFLIHPKLAKMDFGVPSDRIFFYSYSGKKDIFHRHVFNINSYLNRHKSSVFAFRLLRLKPRQLRIYRILPNNGILCPVRQFLPLNLIMWGSGVSKALSMLLISGIWLRNGFLFWVYRGLRTI